MRKVCRVLLVVLIASAIVPLAVVVRAGPPDPVNCCYGTTCPSVQGCTKDEADPGPWSCKRTCTVPGGCNCTQGNGCCQFRSRACIYTPELTCSIHNSSEVVDVSWSNDKTCYASGGGSVACCATSDPVPVGHPGTQCAQ